MPDEQVSASTRNALPTYIADRSRIELRRESLVEPFERPEITEPLLVARRVRGAPRNHVATVLAVFARSSDERSPARERRSQFVPEPRRGRAGEPSLPVRERENHAVVAALSADRFLDQPPSGDFPYPREPSWSE